MKIDFLGTGAADAKSGANNGKKHGFFSSVLIDGTLLIDPGPDVFQSSEKYGISLEGVKYIINTHMHTDHYSDITLGKLLINGARFITFEPGETKTAGKYEITALSGNHGTSTFTLHFMISDGAKSFYYALDGAWLLYDEYIAIKTHKPNMAVFDATVGNKKGDYRVFEHNNLRMVEEMTYSLKQYIDKIYISHIAVTLHEEHKELTESMHKYGINVAYDGLTVKI